MVIQLTDRDEAMLAWLNVVRMADLEAVKFALAGLAGAVEPVGKRRANQWVARMEKAGWVTRTRPTYKGSHSPAHYCSNPQSSWPTNQPPAWTARPPTH